MPTECDTNMHLNKPSEYAIWIWKHSLICHMNINVNLNVPSEWESESGIRICNLPSDDAKWIWTCHLNAMRARIWICHLQMPCEYESTFENAIFICMWMWQCPLIWIWICHLNMPAVIWVCQNNQNMSAECYLNMNAHVTIPYEYECKSEYDMCNMPFECAKLIWVCHLNAVRVCIWICHLNMWV